jgi:RNA polymerase sigma factor (sigma-70 family)
MPAASIRATAAPVLPRRSKRLLALAGDDKLVDQVRAGNEAAFEVVFERHSPAILGFCRHMLGSVQEAEDVVQHTFAAAYRALLADDRPVVLKPWLFTIARNRSLSALRARRDEVPEPEELPTTGLSEQVERRAELRDLLADVRDLPDDQRAALLLAEAGDLSHAEVAEVLGCEVQQVKALVFRARSGLIERREARDTACEEIREQLANLSGGSLRRNGLRHHLRICAGCREYRDQVKRQRRLLAAALPVTPSLGLKSSVLSALGLGGGTAGGGGALAGGLGAAVAAPLGSTAAKVGAIAVLAAGSVAAGEKAFVQPQPGPTAPASVPAQHPRPAESVPPPAAAPTHTQRTRPAAPGKRLAKGHTAKRGHGRLRAPGQAKPKHGKGAQQRAAHAPAAPPAPKAAHPARPPAAHPKRPAAAAAPAAPAKEKSLPDTPGREHGKALGAG